MAKRKTVWAMKYPVPVRMPSGKAYRARLRLYDKIGPGPHPCEWCGMSLDWVAQEEPNAIEADHLGEVDDDRPEMLVASCRSCNCSRKMGTLWLKFPRGPRRHHAMKWCERKAFKCGHPISTRNAYRTKRGWKCLTCHRAAGLHYYYLNKAKKAAEAAS